MKITIRMLTPLWTGGIAGTMDRAHETGIMGSLRWWYEAVVRGLGGRACDPSQGACGFDADAYKKAIDEGKSPDECLSQAGLCDVCRIFGATGWRRRFQLRVGGMAQKAWHPPPAGLKVCPPDRSRGWFLPPGGVGDLELQIHGEDAAQNRIAALLLFLEKHGAIGARPQLGYGVFQIVSGRDLLIRKAAHSPWPRGKTISDQNLPDLPDLRNIVFFRFTFQPDGPNWWSHVSGLERLLGSKDTAQVLSQLAKLKMIPVAPALKNLWRYGAGERISDARTVFGTTTNDRIRSKIAVSWAYPQNGSWRVRGWAWLPSSLSKPDRISMIKRIQDQAVWRETLKVRTGDLTETVGLNALNRAGDG